MAYKVIILYRLYMPSYFLGTFTEYPYYSQFWKKFPESMKSNIKNSLCSNHKPNKGSRNLYLKKSTLPIEISINNIIFYCAVNSIT